MVRTSKKQGRRSSRKEGSNGSEEVEPSRVVLERNEKEQADAMQMMRANVAKPLAVLAKEIRDGLRQNGTNVVQNDNDPMGDGDQSAIIEGEEQRQYHRVLFGTGGDIFNGFQPGSAMSPFVYAVLMGFASGVESMLKEADVATATTGNGGMPSPDLVALLETRETSLRLSPILMIVAICKNRDPEVSKANGTTDASYIAVAKLLLKYGARPDARDVVGKTVFHYGAGAYATNLTLAVADLCLQAQEGGSHLFGKKVTLVNLSNEAMNGKEGIALGFDVDTGRRAVSLPDGKSRCGRRRVAVKPENLILTNTKDLEEAKARPIIRLCDIQDRLGGVSFLEVIMRDRVDVAKFLLERNARLDIVDLDGDSPLSIAMSQESQFDGRVARLIDEHVSAAARRGRRKLCSGCGEDETNSSARLNLCSGCKATRYCSKECQLRHWKESHKVECRAIRAKKEQRVVLERTATIEVDPRFVSVRNVAPSAGNRICNGDWYRIPRGIRTGQKFTIKVQAAGTREEGTLLIHNEARDCRFLLQHDHGGYKELFDAVSAEKATNGSKAFMKALFDENGNCVAFPGDTTIHTW